ncbi:MAG: hypothetical protein WA705_17215 [Candidatus Ozemobacteraceae bacterium]
MEKDFGKFVNNSFSSVRWALVLAVLACSSPGITPSYERCWAQEADSKGEAKSLFTEALNLKKAGKFDDAAKNFEKAVRKDRSILGDDDNGLIGLLREMYAKRITASPEDVEALEGAGFVASVCDADYAKAIEQYSKLVSLTKDEQVKTRVTGLIDVLKAQLAATGAGSSSSGTSGSLPKPEAAPQNPASGSENPDAPDKIEAAARREAKMSELTRSKEEKENRLPQLEAEIKSIEDENERNHRMYLSTNDRRYKRKEDTGEQGIEAKKREIEKLRGEIDGMGKDIDRLNSGDPEKAPEGDEPEKDE